MEALRKPVAVFLMLGALAVLVHFWLSPFYPDSWDVGTIWEVLDVIMGRRDRRHAGVHILVQA